jgi:hypothetical protein
MASDGEKRTNTDILLLMSKDAFWNTPTEKLPYFTHMPPLWATYIENIFESPQYHDYEGLDVRGQELDAYLKKMGFTGMTEAEKERVYMRRKGMDRQRSIVTWITAPRAPFPRHDDCY